eukprot:6184027-Pleurochrysis_carterae.AAC.4
MCVPSAVDAALTRAPGAARPQGRARRDQPVQTDVQPTCNLESAEQSRRCQPEAAAEPRREMCHENMTAYCDVSDLAIHG